MAREAFDLRLIAPFVAVAEERHFGRASARLGVAAPALSQQIARLERQLGVRLFERDGRRRTMTPAGQRFLHEVREILARASSLQAGVADQDADLRLHVGFADNTRLNRLITTFTAANPDVTVTFVPGSLSGGGAVAAGDAEIAMEFREGVPPGLEYLAVDRRRMGLLCARTHRHAGRAELPWSALAEEPVLVAPPGWWEGYNACLRTHLDRYGVRCREVVGPRYQPSMLVDHVASGVAVAVAASFPERPWPADLAWVPLTPSAYFEFGVVWHRERLGPAGRGLLEWMAADVEHNPVEPAGVDGSGLRP